MNRWVQIMGVAAVGAVIALAGVRSPSKLHSRSIATRLGPNLDEPRATGVRTAPISTPAAIGAANPAPSARARTPTDFWLAPRCPGIRTSIVSQDSDPRASLATLHWRSARGFQATRIDDVVQDRRVVFIGTSPRAFEPSVWLEANGSLCQVGLQSPEPEGARPPGPGARPAPRRDLRALMGPVRTIPVAKGGNIEGFRVTGMRPGSLLTLIGIQNGDVIESFDGKDLATPERALEAYAVLMNRSAERLSLGIRRRGAPVTITYRLN